MIKFRKRISYRWICIFLEIWKYIQLYILQHTHRVSASFDYDKIRSIIDSLSGTVGVARDKTANRARQPRIIAR